MKNTLGELEQTILLAVLRLGDLAYGVSIRREIALCTRREIAPGALYTTLDRLEQKAIVVARDGDPTHHAGKLNQPAPLECDRERVARQQVHDREHHGVRST